MKFVSIACIIIAAAGSATALDGDKIASAAIKEFTPYHPSIFKWVSTITVKVEDENGNPHNCVALLSENLRQALVEVKMNCGGEDIHAIFYKELSNKSPTPQFVYYDENKEKHILPLKKDTEVV